jgi:hypothetical protein
MPVVSYTEDGEFLSGLGVSDLKDLQDTLNFR